MKYYKYNKYYSNYKMNNRETNIYAKILSQALYNLYDKNGFEIEYKTDKYKYYQLKKYDCLKKYSLLELREIALLIFTNPFILANKEDKKKIKLVIKFIETDLFKLNKINKSNCHLNRELNNNYIKSDIKKD